MKLAIVGSRSFNDMGKLSTVVQTYFFRAEFYPITIVSGGAKGTDTLAEQFATDFNWKTEIYLPDWDKDGKIAGFLRNQKIVDACDVLLAFWDGKSKGTKDSIDKARRAKKPTLIIYV